MPDSHRFNELFSQLGLPNTPQGIAAFIQRHRPLAGDVLLVDAPFWSPSQAAFLREKRAADAPEWVQLIDQLSAALREPGTADEPPSLPRLLGISGSLRSGSYNTALLRAAQAASSGVARWQLATLHGIPLYDGDEEDRHGLPAAVVALRQQIGEADGVLLCSPEYNSGVPGVLKNALDWVSRVSPQHPNVLMGKPVAVIGASTGGFGSALVQAHWLPVLRALGMRIWAGGRLVLPHADRAFAADGQLADEAQRQQLAQFVQGFAHEAHALASAARG